MIFGADDESVPWWWLAIVGAGGSAVTWLAAQGWRWLAEKRIHEKEVKREALDAAYALLDRLREDIDRTDAKLEDLTKKHNRCEVKYERAVARIEHLEEALTNAKIPFRPWRDPDESTEHRPLSGGGS